MRDERKDAVDGEVAEPEASGAGGSSHYAASAQPAASISPDTVFFALMKMSPLCILLIKQRELHAAKANVAFASALPFSPPVVNVCMFPQTKGIQQKSKASNASRTKNSKYRL